MYAATFFARDGLARVVAAVRLRVDDDPHVLATWVKEIDGYCGEPREHAHDPAWLVHVGEGD